MQPGKLNQRVRTAVLVALSCFTIFSVAGAPTAKAAGKELGHRLCRSCSRGRRMEHRDSCRRQRGGQGPWWKS